MMGRHKNAHWDLPDENGKVQTWQQVEVAVMMDLRDELQTLVGYFASLPCIPGLLRRIERQLKLQRRCPVHPRYTARRKPTSQCRACWRYYRAVWK